MKDRSMRRSRLFRFSGYLGRLLATVALVLPSACHPEPPQMDPEVHREEIDAWHARRMEQLRQPDGWLSVIGLDWLEQGENTFGSDSANAVVFPMLPGVPARAGTFVLEGEQVRMEVEPGVDVTNGGELVTSLVLYPTEGQRPVSPRLASLRWQVIQRQDLIGIRLRDTANAAIGQGYNLVASPSAPSHASEFGACPPVCRHGWK